MSGLTRMARWLSNRAENILALMLGIMFAAFIVQIVFRYTLRLPTGWAHELSAILWIWIVLFGAAFVLRSSDEIRLDIIYSSVSAKARRVMTVLTSLSLAALFAVSMPAIVDYVLFMKIEKSAYLDIRFDYIYSIFIAFAAITIMRQLWRAAMAVWGRIDDEEGASS